jgi:hypothetical protein
LKFLIFPGFETWNDRPIFEFDTWLLRSHVISSLAIWMRTGAPGTMVVFPRIMRNIYILRAILKGKGTTEPGAENPALYQGMTLVMP